MWCIRVDLEGDVFWEHPVVAVRRGVVNFHFFGDLKRREFFGFVGPPREVFLIFVDDGRGLLRVMERGEPWLEYGRVDGYVADLPAPPLPGVTEDGDVVWSRLAARGDAPENPVDVILADRPAVCRNDCRYRLVEDGSLTLLLKFLSLRFTPSLPRAYDVEAVAWWNSPYMYLPGKGKLTREEFKIVEPDNDYLRLVGRGGDEYLAWDFVLGTLDTGEWILMGDDGLYVAKREGDKVVVKWPYHGSVFDVRGPPYAPFYPVVAVKWIRERFERAKELAARRSIRNLEIYQPPVDAAYLLRWPLVQFPWEYEVVCGFTPYGWAKRVDCGEVCKYLKTPWCGEIIALMRESAGWLT